MNQPKEIIGRCELCGLIDHHLPGGLCSECLPRVQAVDVRIGGRKRGVRIAGAMCVEYDSARNPMIRLKPVVGEA